MKISVIIPNFNMEKYIEKTLQSLEQQTLSKDEFEVIIVDNNSTDNSISIIQRFLSNKLNFYFYKETSQDPSYCRNT